MSRTDPPGEKPWGSTDPADGFLRQQIGVMAACAALVQVLLSPLCFFLPDRSRFLASSLVGSAIFIAVYGLHALSCLGRMNWMSPQAFAARIFSGFLIKIVLTAGLFCFACRHGDLDLRFAAGSFAASVLLCSFAGAWVAVIRMK